MNLPRKECLRLNKPPPNQPNVTEQIQAEHRALAILRILQRQIGYRSNERVLGGYLDGLALGGSAEQISESVNTLERPDLPKCSWHETLMIVTLTELGEEVALGRRNVERVLRPGPECPY